MASVNFNLVSVMLKTSTNYVRRIYIKALNTNLMEKYLSYRCVILSFYGMEFLLA